MIIVDNMTIQCGACRDLLPLYAEGMASGESIALTEAHLNICEPCRAELERVRETPSPAKTPLAGSMRRAKRKLNRKKTVIAVFASLLAAVMAVAGIFSLLAYVTFPADIKPEDVMVVSQYYRESAENFNNGSIPPENYFREQILFMQIKQWYAQNSQQTAVRENEDGSLTIALFCTVYDALWDRIATPNHVREKFEGGVISLSIDEPKLQREEGVWVMRPEPPVVHWKVYFIHYRDWDTYVAADTQLWMEAMERNGYTFDDTFVPGLQHYEFIGGTDQIRPELLEHAVLLAEGTTE
ncbi:MAG: zf-HC2 domain-containing protein [Oscillospiraceae bacterium]|jgi:hypothetical protein|nr:zf-HC2 domain-containing protein [Oscillospiraceae bacterium]